MTVKETGPWTVEVWGERNIVVMSDDFNHDVALRVDGDFADDVQRVSLSVGALIVRANISPKRCRANERRLQ